MKQPLSKNKTIMSNLLSVRLDISHLKNILLADKSTSKPKSSLNTKQATGVKKR